MIKSSFTENLDSCSNHIILPEQNQKSMKILDRKHITEFLPQGIGSMKNLHMSASRDLLQDCPTVLGIAESYEPQENLLRSSSEDENVFLLNDYPTV